MHRPMWNPHSEMLPALDKGKYELKDRIKFIMTWTEIQGVPVIHNAPNGE